MPGRVSVGFRHGLVEHGVHGLGGGLNSFLAFQLLFLLELLSLPTVLELLPLEHDVLFEASGVHEPMVDVPKDSSKQGNQNDD